MKQGFPLLAKPLWVVFKVARSLGIQGLVTLGLIGFLLSQKAFF